MPLIKTGTTSLFVEDVGTGPVVVLLHAFPLDHRMWQPQIYELRQTCRVLAVDLRGAGKSPVVGDVSSISDLAEDVISLLQERQITERVTLCGLSMGGYTAQVIWERAPERIGRLVLACTRSTIDAPEAAATRLKLADQVLQEGPRVMADAMLPKFFGKSTTEDQPDVVDRVRNLIMAQSSRGIAALQRGLAQRADTTPLLKTISIPTLVIAGREDRITPAEGMQHMAAAIPGSEYVEIAGAGHLPQLEQSGLFGAALRSFLERTQ